MNNFYRQNKYWRVNSPFAVRPSRRTKEATSRDRAISAKMFCRRRNFGICAITTLIMLMLPGNIYLLATTYTRESTRQREPGVQIALVGDLAIPHPQITRTWMNVNTPSPTPSNNDKHVNAPSNNTHYTKINKPQEWELKQADFRENLQHQCSALGLKTNITKDWVKKNKPLLKHLVVSDKHKALYCYVPKVSCTNWKEAFLIMNGKVSLAKATKLSARDVHVRIDNVKWTMNKMSDEDILQRLLTFKSFLFVRNPFTRVLSAYKNKLEYNTPSSKMFRQNFGKSIHAKYGERSNSSKVSGKHVYDATFNEFVKFLGDQTRQMNSNLEEHWAPIFDICYPCSVQYDYIGKLETLKTDSANILEQIGASHLLDVVVGHSPHPTNSSEQNKLKEYFQQLTKKDVDGLIWRYEKDLKLFEYDEEIPF